MFTKNKDKLAFEANVNQYMLANTETAAENEIKFEALTTSVSQLWEQVRQEAFDWSFLDDSQLKLDKQVNKLEQEIKEIRSWIHGDLVDSLKEYLDVEIIRAQLNHEIAKRAKSKAAKKKKLTKIKKKPKITKKRAKK